MASGIRILAHGVHAYTASGLVFNALAMMEVWKAQPDPRGVFGWRGVSSRRWRESCRGRPAPVSITTRRLRPACGLP